MPKSQITQLVRDTLASKKVTFTNVFNALHRPGRVDDKLRSTVVLPKPIAVSPEQEKALDRLPEILAGFAWPDSRRKLSAADRRRAIELLETLRIVEGLNKSVRESLRTTVLNHGDVLLEEGKDLVDDTTPRDKDGHYLVGDEDGFAVDGLTSKINRSVTPPKASVSANALSSVVADPADADEWDEDTRITRKEFLEISRPVRVVEEADVLDFVRKHPERAVAIKNAAVQLGGSLSMLESDNAS